MGLFRRPRAGQISSVPGTSKWKRRLLGAILALLLLVVLSPVLVARTPLRNWIAATVFAPLRGEIRIGGASLGWFTPPVFTDIEVRDRSGRTLLRVPRIEGSRSLAALLCHTSDWGEFRLSRPVLHVVCAGGSTNLEDALAFWLKKKDNRPDDGLALEGFAICARFVQASLTVEDEDSGRSWTLDSTDIALTVPHDRRTPIQLKLNSTGTGPSGRLDAEVTAHLVETSGGKPCIGAEGQLHAEGIPLAAAGPFLRRFDPGLKLDGRLSTHLSLRPGDGQAGSPEERLQGDIAVQDLALGHPLLGPDCLRLARAEMPCRLALEGSRLLVEQIEVRSEVGKASLAGTVDLAKDPREALGQPGQRLEATIDLARLANLVPDALHLTKDTRIASGTLSLRVHSSARPDAVFWEGELRTSDLQGVYQGQLITWKEPFAIVFTARQEANVLPVLEHCRCDADFLHLDMSGSRDEWTARAGFHLGRLSEHLAGLVDLAGLHLQGEGSVRMTARRTPRGGYRLEGDVRVAQLNLSDPAGHAWREDRLTVRLDVVGESAGGSYRVQAGGLHVLAGPDGIDLDLLEPMAEMRAGSAACVRVRVHGDLARWHRRLGSLSPGLNGLRLAGQIEVDGRLRFGPEAMAFEDLKVAGRAVQFVGLGLCVAEPSFDFTTSGRWLVEKEMLELRQTRLSCPALMLQSPAVAVATDRAAALQITADLNVAGDVARLHHWFLSSPYHLNGTLAGQIALRPDDGRQVVRADLNIQNLTFKPPASPAWHEPTIHLTGQGVYDLLADSFRIVQVRVESPALSGNAAGQIAALHGDMALSLEGQCRYDLRKFVPLRTLLDPLVRELSVLLKGPATLSPVRENVVSFQVVNGRVYPRDLELRFPELTVRTSGSVGLDGSLSLVAEMPVPPKWLGSSKLSGALAGQTIRLPIGGSLSKPKIDERALRDASAHFVREGTENVIRHEIDDKLKKEVDNGLRKLFRPRK